MFTVLKLNRKNKPLPSGSKPSRSYALSVKSAMRVAVPIGIVMLSFAAVLVVWQLRSQGTHEGKIAFESGRYIVLRPDSGKLIGNLLPPPPEASPVLQASEGPDITNPTIPATAAVTVDDKDIKLNAAPNMALTEKDTNGLLPIISPDGIKPWKYYARPFNKKPNTASISVVITGLGIHRELTLSSSRLPPEICLSVSPYTTEASSWMLSMRALGHEFLLDLPLESSDFPLTDPGPLALLSIITPEENMLRLKQIMAKTTGFVGLMVPSDEMFFTSPKDFVQPVVKELANRGVMMVVTKSQERPELAAFMKEAETVNLSADIVVRYGSDSAAIKQHLSTIEAVALKRGQGLIVIEASPVALQAIQTWSKNLPARGFQLAPVSALARDNFS